MQYVAVRPPPGPRSAGLNPPPPPLGGSTACWITARLCQILQTPLRRSLEQGRARRQAGPLDGTWTDPRRTPYGPLTHPPLDLFYKMLDTSVRNRILTALGRILELIFHILSHLPLTFGRLSPIFAPLGPSWAQLGPSWAQLGPSWAQLGPSHEPPTLQTPMCSLGV